MVCTMFSPSNNWQSASIGIVLATLCTPGISAEPPAAGPGQIENRSFRVRFDPATGRWGFGRPDGSALVEGAACRALLAGAERSTADPRYSRTAETMASPTAMGAGRQVVGRCVDDQGELDFEVRLALYERWDALTVEAVCRNRSDRPLRVHAIEPIYTAAEDSGGLLWPGIHKVLTNGKMYYDAGALRELPPGGKLRSWWNLCLYRGDREPGLVIGYLENNASLGQVELRRESAPEGPERLSVICDSSLGNGFVLAPGAAVSSDRVVIQLGDNPFGALERYAQSIGEAHDVRLSPVINGWCSWFTFYEAITEDEVLRQARFAARRLKPFGFEYIQVDDGFYRAFGDWDGNARFPHGMKWLAGQIRELGLKPGIWLAPFVIAEGTDIHTNHPDWLVHRPDGKLKQVGPGLVEDSEEARRASPKRYALDITHPGAAEWLRKLFDTVATDWGYDFIKIDFVDWSLLAADRYYDPTVTRAAAYRKGLQIMREAMGPNRHLLDCGPGQVSAGLLDSMRIELDQPPPTWNQYFLNSASTAPAAAKRYYFHRRVWINDADHVCLSLLTPEQAQAAATIVSLSGGTMISGDRMTDLDTGRLEILRKVFPSLGQAARPVDLFERDRPEVFALPVKRAFAEWLVVGLFNADERSPAHKEIALDRLGLDPSKTYLAYDFWKERFFGEVQGTLRMPLAPASVTLLAMHEKRGVPQFISTDRHVSQGGVELDNVAWEPAAGLLRGVSRGPIGSTHRVLVYLPDEHRWVQQPAFFFHDFPGYTLKMMEPHILRVQVRFENSDQVAWTVNPKALFGQ